MFIRWARSNIRESWFYTHFSFQRAKKRGEWLALVDGWIHALQIPAQIYLTLFAFVLVLSYPGFLLRSLAFATAVSLIYVLYFLRSERSSECLFGVLYAWFSILALQWIYPWAAMTVGSNRWLTRNRPQHLAIEHRK
jgi:hyaluronan synthase